MNDRVGRMKIEMYFMVLKCLLQMQHYAEDPKTKAEMTQSPGQGGSEGRYLKAPEIWILTEHHLEMIDLVQLPRFVTTHHLYSSSHICLFEAVPHKH